MDVDRASFIMTVWNVYRNFFEDTSSPNVFRISMSSFEVMSNTTLIGNLYGGVSVFGAYPASQVRWRHSSRIIGLRLFRGRLAGRAWAIQMHNDCAV